MNDENHTMLIIPNGKNTIKKGDFTEDNIEQIIVPHSVYEIEAEAFANWKSLRQIIFTEDSLLLKIGANAFHNSGVESFTAPCNLKVIEKGAFSGCENMKTVDLGSKLEIIEDNCFKDSGLVTLKLSTKNINSAKYVLQGCNTIETVEFKADSEIV